MSAEVPTVRAIEVADVRGRVEALDAMHRVAEEARHNVRAVNDRLIGDLADLMAPAALVEELAKVGAHHVLPQVLDEIRFRVTERASQIEQERERRTREAKS